MKATALTAEEIEKAKQYRREYARAWRKANPERAKEIQLRYWKRKAEKAEDKKK